MAELSDFKYKWWLGDLLELIILVAILCFIAVIYVPRSIWDEEVKVRDESRFRIENVYDVLTYYQRLTGKQTDDAFLALNVVNAARDSLTADSNFLGLQKIILPGKEVTVDLYDGYPAAFDTSFGFFKTRKDTLLDTILTVVSYSEEEESTYDTSFVRLKQVDPYMSDSLFIGIADTTISTHVEIVSYYESYMPDSSMFFCPLTSRPFIIQVGEDMLKVESPIEGLYKEVRYTIFTFKSDSHGKIENGEKSWARL